MTKKYIVKVNNNFWIKYTDHSGIFHGGRTQLTKNKNEARMFTRVNDANNKVSTHKFRYEAYEFERSHYKKKYNIISTPTFNVEKIMM